MATIRDVQKGSGTGQLPAFEVDPSNGDTIVVAQLYNCVGTPVPTAPTAPSDTEGNTYTRVGPDFVIDEGRIGSLWIARNIVGSASFEITITKEPELDGVLDWKVAVAWLISGHYIPNDLATNTSSVISPTVTSASDGRTDAFFFAMLCAGQSSPTFTEAAGWNTTGANGFTEAMLTRSKLPTAGPARELYTMYRIGDSPQTASWTHGGAPGGWFAGITSLRAAGGVPGGSEPGFSSEEAIGGQTIGNTWVEVRNWHRQELGPWTIVE